MNIHEDRDEFSKRQTRLIQEIAYGVKSRLEEMGLGTDPELVEGLVFEICSILDGSREMDLEGNQVRPFLTFAKDEEGEQLIAAEGGSWMHEISGGIVTKILEDEPSA
jgi:hypothetical protein